MTNIEKQIAEKIAKANGYTVTQLGLRFDKVVVRLLADLRAFIERTARQRVTVIVTVTAPIKLPAKTAGELEERIKDLLASGTLYQDRCVAIFENEVCVRIVESPSRQTAELIGFVHNPNIDPKLLLDLAVRWVVESEFQSKFPLK